MNIYSAYIHIYSYYIFFSSFFPRNLQSAKEMQIALHQNVIKKIVEYHSNKVLIYCLNAVLYKSFDLLRCLSFSIT